MAKRKSAKKSAPVSVGTGDEDMTVSSFETIILLTESIDPVVTVFEAVKNGWEEWNSRECEGEHPLIQIFPSEEGYTTVRDNATGIAPEFIKSRLANFGATTKKVGTGEGQNFGWGASLFYAVTGSSITTWTKEGRDAYRAKFGIRDRRFKILGHGRGGEQITTTNKPCNTRSGTEVVIPGVPFDDVQLRTELEDHFARFGTGTSGPEAQVAIYEADPAKSSAAAGRPRILSPLESRLEEARARNLDIETWGIIPTDHAVVYWVIKAENTRGLYGIYEFWNNELVLNTTPGAPSSSRLGSYGIWCATGDIVLLIHRRNADGDKEIKPDLHRTATKFWLDHEAQREIEIAINSSNPVHPLRVHMDRWNEANVVKEDDTGVTAILSRWRTRPAKLEGPRGKEVPGPGGTSTVDKEFTCSKVRAKP